MKNFNLSVFLGCCVIGISIIISGILVSNNLPETTQVPSNLAVTTSSSVSEFADFLSQYEVSAFLKVSDEDVSDLIASDEFDKVGTKVGDSYIFSKVALEAWMNERISEPE
ncbi:MAG: helix-turn-helix domain-containing protein [Clostridiales bacterium]|nr:helix-turn-helix domain-containing protein [Clostridiales bacterium]